MHKHMRCSNEQSPSSTIVKASIFAIRVRITNPRNEFLDLFAYKERAERRSIGVAQALSISMYWLLKHKEREVSL